MVHVFCPTGLYLLIKQANTTQTTNLIETTNDTTYEIGVGRKDRA